MSKKKLLSLALVVIMIAVLSFNTLAWFSDQDSVTNKFMVAGSEDSNPDDIFSVDVWEEGDEEDDGLVIENLLPGDRPDKVAHVKNTGSYDEYIRVKITVSHASIWQVVYNANMVPVTEFVNVDLSKVYGVGSYLDGDNFEYYLYYTDILPVAGDMTVFTKAHVGEGLTREQAAEMKDGFQITVTADAVQTRNVGENVYEAFKTVGMEIPVNTLWVDEKAELIEAFKNDGYYIVMEADIKMANNSQKIQGSNAELYMNGKTLTTAPGTEQYGVLMTGDLTISGNGKLEVRAADMKVCGKLTLYGITISGQGEIHDANGNLIPLE